MLPYVFLKKRTFFEIMSDNFNGNTFTAQVLVLDIDACRQRNSNDTTYSVI